MLDITGLMETVTESIYTKILGTLAGQAPTSPSIINYQFIYLFFAVRIKMMLPVPHLADYYTFTR